jgi:hypothetical protein
MPVAIVSQVVMDANTVTTITSNINSLYSNAISQLTAYTLGVVALVGILIPVLVTLIQWRSLKAEKDNLERHISDEITKAKSNIRDELEAEMKQLILSEESKLFARVEGKFKELEDKLACTDAASFHIQGNEQIAKGYFSLAVEDFCYAAMGYLRGGDAQNGQRVLRLLIEKCLPYVDKNEFEEMVMDEKVDELIAFLKKSNDGERYSDQITELIRLKKAAKIREPKVEG